MEERFEEEIERLSDGELQDLVVVATPTTHPEAIYLVDRLQEAEVPAITRQRYVYFMADPGLEICVPRLLVEKALVEIAKARGQTLEIKHVPPPPVRGLFHIRLGTCLALMLAAGWLLMKNLTPTAERTYGWPFRVRYVFRGTINTDVDSVIYNLAVALVMLIAVTLVSEWWFRQPRDAD